MPAERSFRDRRGTSFELIETLRLEDSVFVRLDRHLARLEDSARALGFDYDSGAVPSALDVVKGELSAQRVRLTLAQDGSAKATSAAFSPLPTDTVWRLAIAKTRLDSADRLLRHKTTRRERYERAREEFATDIADEVLLLNERGEVCEGTITTLFVDFGDGVLMTPPLSSGLLAGVLRAEMLDEGRAREAIITLDTLGDAHAIYVGNSLRGLVRAHLAADGEGLN